MQKKESVKRINNVKLQERAPVIKVKNSKIFIDPTIRLGEIILAKVTYVRNGTKTSDEVVYKKPSNGEMFTDYFCGRFKRITGVSTSKITKIEIIVRTGFEHKNKGFRTGTKSEEKRDKITGKYD
jgi:hypothetical protein